MNNQTKSKVIITMISALIMVFVVNCSGSGEKEDNEGTGGSNCVVSTVGAVNDADKVLSPRHNAAAHGTSKHAASGNVANCSGCHGASLGGNSSYTLVSGNSSTGVDIAGTTPPCCTSCHSVKW